jgi:hypothetical protein
MLVHIIRLQKRAEYLSRKRERIPNGFPIFLEVEVRSKILHENNFSTRNLFYQKIPFFPYLPGFTYLSSNYKSSYIFCITER